MKKNIDARIQRSHAAIIKAGLELLNNNSEATLSDIAQHAEVGRATLYRLFDTKEQLIKAIAFDCLESFDLATKDIELQADSALGIIRLLIQAIIPLSPQLQFLFNLNNLTFEDPELASIFAKQQQEMIYLIDMAKQEGSIDPDMPSFWIANVFEALLYPAWLMTNEQGYSNEEATDITFKTLCRGVCL